MDHSFRTANQPNLSKTFDPASVFLDIYPTNAPWYKKDASRNVQNVIEIPFTIVKTGNNLNVNLKWHR